MHIALLTHSLNPRGGVVHVLELGAALMRRGHAVTVIAPAERGRRLFRPTPCAVEYAPAPAPVADLAQTVRARIAAMREHVSHLLAAQSFDVFHAHDGIGANALADLKEQGRIAAYARTVHHVDRYGDAQVQAWEERSIRAATEIFCVSTTWCQRLAAEWGLCATQVANGVDLSRFSPAAQGGDRATLERLGVGMGGSTGGSTGGRCPVVLSVGGVEARKNSVRLLRAFILLRQRMPRAQLVMAGGASLLDHSAELQGFRAEAAAAGLGIGPGEAIVLTGPLPDEALPALYRGADVLAMPSLLEGFGLAALEGLACGTPAVVSAIAPFTEHFGDGDVEWADPGSAESIASALQRAVARGRHRAAPEVCRRFSWGASAAQHESLYRRMQPALKELACLP